jgi:hypothetical protein
MLLVVVVAVVVAVAVVAVVAAAAAAVVATMMAAAAAAAATTRIFPADTRRFSLVCFTHNHVFLHCGLGWEVGKRANETATRMQYFMRLVKPRCCVFSKRRFCRPPYSGACSIDHIHGHCASGSTSSDFAMALMN